MLFTDTFSPFITILAVDPHVIIKGIEQNLQGLFRDSSISGHDYLRNIVHLPFYLQSQVLPKPRYSRVSESVPGQNTSEHSATAHNVGFLIIIDLYTLNLSRMCDSRQIITIVSVES